MRLLLFVMLLALCACSQTYPNKDITGLTFPSVKGASLENKEHNIPADFKSQPVILLIGYKQNSQFDIDRWLIGLDMTGTSISAYELPTIAGLAPKMFKTFIDNGMRSGIPKELWGGVITIYADGERVQAFTGNENPNNARVVLLDDNSKIVYFHDRGFSVSALNDVRSALAAIEQPTQ